MNARTPTRVAACGMLLCLAMPVLADEALLQRRSFVTAELAAATSKQFYLVFDGSGPAIDLKIEGVRVHRFALDGAELGQSRLVGPGQRHWPSTSFSLVSEVPAPDRPRIEIEKSDQAKKERDARIKQALAKGQKPAGELSQTPGEKVAQLYLLDDLTAPMTFSLRFDPDLVLVVRGEPRATDLGSRLRWIRYTLQEGWQAVGLWLTGKSIATRVVVYLPPEEARRLFKVLTPEIRLLIFAPPA